MKNSLLLKPVDILIALYNVKVGFALELAKKTALMNMTVCKNLQRFKKEQLITSVKVDGRTNGYKLTDKGKKVTEHFIKIISLIGG